MAGDVRLYRPRDGWFGDVMPIYADDTHHLFYTFLSMHDLGAPGKLRKLSWAHISTTDFVHFTEHPIAIPAGDESEPDLLAGAGSVVRGDDGRYVAFYCGINPQQSERGLPEQVVLRATSDDLVTWTKDPDFWLEADPRWYERNDWRDPFVYRDADGWRMLLCARVTDGPFDRRGAIGQATSPDLVHWTVEEPLLAPGITRAPECPEIFELEGHRYLLLSTYSDRFASRYRVRSGDGWQRPTFDALDTNDLYAVKSTTDGAQRFAIGWLASRYGDRDTGHRQWGGDLVAHELHARTDGTLGATPTKAFVAQYEFGDALAEARMGKWELKGGEGSYLGSGFGWCALGEVASGAALEVTLDLTQPAEEVGIALRAGADFASSYLLRFEVDRNRVVFDRRPHRVDVPFEYDSNRSYVSAVDCESERPLPPGDLSAVRVRVFVVGVAILAYVGDVALSTVGYDLNDGEFGVYATNGNLQFSEARVGRPVGSFQPAAARGEDVGRLDDVALDAAGHGDDLAHPKSARPHQAKAG